MYIEGARTIRFFVCYFDMSLIMRKPAFCICENKGAVQLGGNRAADQGLLLCYIDSTIPPKFQASNHLRWVDLDGNPEDWLPSDVAHI